MEDYAAYVCEYCTKNIPIGVNAGMIHYHLQPVTPGAIDGAWTYTQVFLHRTCLEAFTGHVA